MGLSAEFYVCIGFAAALLLAMISRAVNLRCAERRTISDSFAAMERIREWALQLSDLPEKERAALRRAIVREILLDVVFILSIVRWRDYDDSPESDEVRERREAAAIEIVELILELRKTQFVFRFRPKMVADCRRVYQAIEGHYRAWIAFLHFLKAKYPEDYAGLSVPEPSDETPC